MQPGCAHHPATPQPCFCLNFGGKMSLNTYCLLICIFLLNKFLENYIKICVIILRVCCVLYGTSIYDQFVDDRHIVISIFVPLQKECHWIYTDLCVSVCVFVHVHICPTPSLAVLPQGLFTLNFEARFFTGDLVLLVFCKLHAARVKWEEKPQLRKHLYQIPVVCREESGRHWLTG